MEQCKIYAVRNSQEAAQISPKEFYPIYTKKKKLKRQPLKILIPKEDEESLNQRHTRVVWFKSKRSRQIRHTFLEHNVSLKIGS